MNKATARNIRVQNRYDELMTIGRHGHYETMFRIVREEVELAEAIRDAEIAGLHHIIDEEAKYSALVIIERDQLREELVKALAACKAKDEALESCGFDDDSTDPEMCGSYYDAELVQRALDIQPDDSALKAWLGEPVAWKDAYGSEVEIIQ